MPGCDRQSTRREGATPTRAPGIWIGERGQSHFNDGTCNHLAQNSRLVTSAERDFAISLRLGAMYRICPRLLLLVCQGALGGFTQANRVERVPFLLWGNGVPGLPFPNAKYGPQQYEFEFCLVGNNYTDEQILLPLWPVLLLLSVLFHTNHFSVPQ